MRPVEPSVVGWPRAHGQPAQAEPALWRVASDDLFHNRGLGVGIVLHVAPGPLGQVAFDLQVGIAVGVVRLRLVPEPAVPLPAFQATSWPSRARLQKCRTVALRSGS
jgi:hypothetical protein